MAALVVTMRSSEPPVSDQVVVDTDKTSFSLWLQSRQQLNTVVGHVNLALARIFNNSVFAWVPPAVLIGRLTW